MTIPLHLLLRFSLVLFAVCIYLILRKKYLLGGLFALVLIILALFSSAQIIPTSSLLSYCQQGYLSVKNCPSKIVLTYFPMEADISWNCYTKWGWRTGHNCNLDECSNTPNLCQ